MSLRLVVRSNEPRVHPTERRDHKLNVEFMVNEPRSGGR